MASIIQRITTWASAQVLKAADLNGEFNNVVTVLNSLDSATTTWDNVKVTTFSPQAGFTLPGNLTFSSTATQGIVGSTTNDAAAAGSVGEWVKSGVSTLTSFPSSNVWGDLTSLNTTSGGDFDFSAILIADLNSATMTGYNLGIGTSSGNNNTGLVLGDNYVAGLPPTASTDTTITIAAFRMSFTTATTVYLKYLAAYSLGTPKAYGRISCRRVR